MPLSNQFKEVEKSALYAFKEVLKELQEPDAISSIVVDVDLTAKQKMICVRLN